MYFKIIDEQILINNYLQEITACLENIDRFINMDLPLCKKHSAVMVSHHGFDYGLAFLKSFKEYPGYPAEMVAKLDEINVYLIYIIRKRLYVYNDQKLKDYLAEITAKFAKN